jgi:hypothetical protein
MNRAAWRITSDEGCFTSQMPLTSQHAEPMR